MYRGVRMGKIDPKIPNTIKKFKDSIKTKYHIKDMVFFGSMATGTATEGSDIDLIVVVDKYDKNIDETLIVECHDRDNIKYLVDFIQCSKKRFYELSKGINIVSQALKEGVVV